MKNFFKTTSQKEATTPDVITSEVIAMDMDRELSFLFDDNNNSLIEGDIKKMEDSHRDIIDKGKKLHLLGFSNTPSAVLKHNIEGKISQKKESIELSVKELELSKKYLLKFPSYKFVPERIFISVCEKYDLYTSSPGRYIKEIPEKNLDEIVNFEPLIKDVWTVSMQLSGAFSRSPYIVEKFPSENLAQDYVDDKYQREPESNSYYTVDKKQKFQITAPISHFNLDKSEVRGRIISDKVEDPIVSHVVDGGRIIVSVWDKEADIPEIKNENLN